MGVFQGGSFKAIQDYFQQKNCRFCCSPFTSEGVKLLREEPGIIVVRVVCMSCGHPLGVAIVGTSRVPSRYRHYPSEWTKKDYERFASQPAITYDDVLEAHEFLAGLGADWTKHLPASGMPGS